MSLFSTADMTADMTPGRIRHPRTQRWPGQALSAADTVGVFIGSSSVGCAKATTLMPFHCPSRFLFPHHLHTHPDIQWTVILSGLTLQESIILILISYYNFSEAW